MDVKILVHIFSSKLRHTRTGGYGLTLVKVQGGMDVREYSFS